MITYKYKLYKTDNTRLLQETLAEACHVWNHALALQKRYYRLYQRFVSANAMQKHFTKVWHRHYLGSQSLQEILQRQDNAYKRFFKHIAKRPPKFKKTSDFTSFLYKQCGYKFCDGNRLVLSIGEKKVCYKFSCSHNIEGTIKMVSVKRNHLNEYFIVVVTDANPKCYAKTHDGASVGMDFGLKTYLTLSDGSKINNPQFLKKSLRRLQRASKHHSKCVKGSNNREKVRLSLCRLHEKVSDSRKDFQWKLAHSLCRQFDNIFIEDLNLSGMTRIWGRKMNDLAHGEFVGILEQVAVKYGCTVHKIDKWFPSSKLCDCGYKNTMLRLSDREWVCPQCGQVHDRDLLAARNILRRGIYELESNRKTDAALQQGSCV